MKALSLSVRLVVTATTAALGVCALSSLSGASIKDSSTADTPLPAGWELCILQGVNAPATPANVADLDEWQSAEGGSTNNTAAYNPFNTARTTDVNNTPLPLTISANGFPAFTDWIAGCAATVATILQPNMTTIAAGLRSGAVTPPTAFLAVVDQSQWCAPSADGTPCYSDMILGTTGSLATEVLNASPALEVYGNVRSDLRSYQLSLVAAATEQEVISTTDQQLTAAQANASTARSRASAAEGALRRFAINEYVNSGLYQSSPILGGSTAGTPSQDGVTAHQYSSFVAAGLLAQSRAAAAAARAAAGARNAVEKTLQQDVTTLTSDTTSQNRSLIRLVADVTTLQKAGACTTAVITTPTPPTSAPSASTPSSTGSALGSTSTSVPSTTTTTVAPTTTTTSSTTTTTSTTTPGVGLTNPLETTTTVATTNTTTTSTTTTTVPAGSATGTTTAPPPTANPTGLQVLAGCVTALAPTGTT